MTRRTAVLLLLLGGPALALEPGEDARKKKPAPLPPPAKPPEAPKPGKPKRDDVLTRPKVRR